MKRYISVLLALFLIFGCLVAETGQVNAAQKATKQRAISIVFDNSGSMYQKNNKAWCRATYAMEVFASMLNTGDVLHIYPMNPITVDNAEYTMKKPLAISDSTQANKIREIFTPDGGKTYISSIDYAAKGLKQQTADEKYLIILTDGGTFTKDNGKGMSKSVTKTELDKRIKALAGKDMNVMYLGIDEEACMPGTAQSAYFTKNKAENSADVLSKLTVMCNQIFGRDVLPSNHKSGNSIDFDISMSKLIVFVQGENIADLKITGSSVGQQVSVLQTKYSTKGAGDYKSVPDTSLQGMMVTYEDCAAGKYNIEYTGQATSVEVYYEPDADLDFVFTDAEGNTVDYQALYEGQYKVSFGMKDAKADKLIDSDLLGNPHYEGSYSINGEKTAITYDGYSGEVPITLKTNDTFEAELTVTYLSGYKISKNSDDFGWPKGGVKVSAPPLGKFGADLTVSQDYILIKELAQTEQFVVDLTIDGRKLTAEEFDAVSVSADCGGIAHTLTPKKEASRYLINLESTPGIAEDNYQIAVEAKYLDEVDREAYATDSANITLSNTPLWVKWALGLLLLLILLLIIWAIMHIKVLPSYPHISKKESKVLVDGEDVTKFCSFSGSASDVVVKYGGNKLGLTFPVKAGKESYLYKSQTKRYAEVINPDTVKRIGNANIESANIGSVRYVLNDKGLLERKPAAKSPLNLKHGMSVIYSGTINSAGVKKSFNVNTKLNFKKK